MNYKGKRPSERAERRRRMISVVCGIISAVCIVGIIVLMWLTDQQLREIDNMLTEIEAMTGQDHKKGFFIPTYQSEMKKPFNSPGN